MKRTFLRFKRYLWNLYGFLLYKFYKGIYTFYTYKREFTLQCNLPYIYMYIIIPHGYTNILLYIYERCLYYHLYYILYIFIRSPFKNWKGHFCPFKFFYKVTYTLYGIHYIYNNKGSWIPFYFFYTYKRIFILYAY